MLCLPGGEGPLAFLAVETFQNGRVEAPGQTLDDLIRIDRSIDDFFLFVQVHLLFRSTAWLMGVISLQSPKCGMREAGPALRQGWPLNFSVRNTEIRAPAALPPQTRPLGRVHGQAGRFLTKTKRKK